MKRDALLKRIAALRSRTTAAGCTEAEALSAAAKAAELMREYEVETDQLGMAQEGVQVKTSPRSPASQLWSTIGACTNTASIFTRSQVRREVLFIGREPYPTIAVYLLEVCQNAIHNELKTFRKGEFYRRRRSPTTKRQAAEDFLQGLVMRLRRRLLDLFADRCDPTAAVAASEELDRRFPGSSTIRRPERKPRFDEAVANGWSAGGKVNLAHGVNGRPKDPLLIGGR